MKRNETTYLRLFREAAVKQQNLTEIMTIVLEDVGAEKLGVVLLELPSHFFSLMHLAEVLQMSGKYSFEEYTSAMHEAFRFDADEWVDLFFEFTEGNHVDRIRQLVKTAAKYDHVDGIEFIEGLAAQGVDFIDLRDGLDESDLEDREILTRVKPGQYRDEILEDHDAKADDPSTLTCFVAGDGDWEDDIAVLRNLDIELPVIIATIAEDDADFDCHHEVAEVLYEDEGYDLEAILRAMVSQWRDDYLAVLEYVIEKKLSNEVIGRVLRELNLTEDQVRDEMDGSDVKPNDQAEILAAILLAMRPQA